MIGIFLVFFMTAFAFVIYALIDVGFCPETEVYIDGEWNKIG